VLCEIPTPPPAALMRCQNLTPLPAFLMGLDGADADDLEAWLDEKNSNLALNAARARECALFHDLAITYIQSLP
jgi:hypothetical protein